METSCTYTGKEAYFSSDEQKWRKKILTLKEQHPDEVTILRAPEENDGCIYAKIPSAWFKIQPKFKREYTDEQRAEMRARLAEVKHKTRQDVWLENQ